MTDTASLRALPAELRQAGLAAVALVATMALPWYQKSFFTGGQAVSTNMSAFAVFSFVEAAIMLVSVAVLVLIWARSERKGFHLPGGDGTVIMGAGVWAFALLVWRLFDKPEVQDRAATIGIQWGIFVALAAAGILTAAGARVRAVDRPEPPNPVAAQEPSGGTAAGTAAPSPAAPADSSPSAADSAPTDKETNA